MKWILIGVILLFLVSLNSTNAQDLLAEITVSDEFNTLAWNNNSEFLAAGGKTGIYIYDPGLRELAHIPAISGGEIWQLAWSPNGHYLASLGLLDKSVQIWRWDEKTNLFTLERTITNSLEFDEISAMAWSSNGYYLAFLDETIPQGCGCSVGMIEIWNTQTWTLEKVTTEKIQLPGGFISWSPDSKRIAGAGDICIPNEVITCPNPYFYIIDISTGETIFRSNQIMIIDYLYGITWSENDKLAIAETDATYTFDAANLQMLSSFGNYAGATGASDLYWLPASNRLVSVSYPQNEVYVTDTTTNAVLLQFSIDDFNVTALSPDGTKLAVTYNESHRLQIWEIGQLIETSIPTITPYPTDTPFQFLPG